MNIRSLLLGSLALAGLSTTGYAADLGVATSLDTCDTLGLTGLTISSETNCLQISGNVKYEFDYGNYEAKDNYMTFSNNTGNNYGVIDDNGDVDSDSDLDAWIKFVGTAGSDFGNAQAVLKLISENGTGNADQTVGVDEAWVGVGDTTMIMAGYKSSIFNNSDDTPLNYLTLFNSESVNTGVGFAGDVNVGGEQIYSGTRAFTGGNVIQIVSDLGNGITVKGGIENAYDDDSQIPTDTPIEIPGAAAGDPPIKAVGGFTAVGVVQYAGDNITAHVSGAYDTFGNYRFHSGFTGSWDPIKVVAAVSGNNVDGDNYAGVAQDTYLNGLLSASATFDMFTIAGSVEATTGGYFGDELGYGGSITAKISDGVTFNLGGRYFTSEANGEVSQVEAAITTAVTETISLNAGVGYESSSQAGAADPNGVLTGDGIDDVYGKLGATWNPGGGFSSSGSIRANTLGGYKSVFTASKSFQ